MAIRTPSISTSTETIIFQSPRARAPKAPRRRRDPTSTFQKMKGDRKVLTKIEEAEELLKSLRQALTSK
jgi:hypothetical protein